MKISELFNRNLLLRFLTAVVGLPLLIMGVHVGGAVVSGGLVVASGLAAFEYFTVAARGDPLARALGVGLSMGVAALASFAPLLPLQPADAVSVGLLGVMAAVVAWGGYFVLRTGDITTAWPRATQLALGVVWTGLPLSFIARIRHLPDGELWCYLPMVLTWGNDTFAYFCGRLLGRHKMAPVISPGKTWEGAIGAAVLTVAAALLWRALAHPALTVVDCVALGLGTAVLGPVGDLFESMWKRSAGIKDSGALIPGHGGVLDRIDAIMFTGPFLYFWAAHLHPAFPG